MKIKETTEEVSSHPGGKGHWRRKKQRNTPSAREKSRAEWQKGLQMCGEGTESRKMLTLVVSKKSNGKSQINARNPGSRTILNSA
jgi:hypothetical protein